RAHAFLQEKRIALRTLNEQQLEGCQTRVAPKQGVQQLVRAHRRQRVEPQLCVVGLAAPGVLVLRPIVDQQQQSRRWQALDQAVEQGLRLRINPVQILEDRQERLLLALAQQHTLEGVEGALAALGWIELQERAVVR